MNCAEFSDRVFDFLQGTLHEEREEFVRPPLRVRRLRGPSGGDPGERADPDRRARPAAPPTSGAHRRRHRPDPPIPFRLLRVASGLGAAAALLLAVTLFATGSAPRTPPLSSSSRRSRPSPSGPSAAWCRNTRTWMRRPPWSTRSCATTIKMKRLSWAGAFLLAGGSDLLGRPERHPRREAADLPHLDRGGGGTDPVRGDARHGGPQRVSLRIWSRDGQKRVDFLGMEGGSKPAPRPLGPRPPFGPGLPLFCVPVTASGSARSRTPPRGAQL